MKGIVLTEPLEIVESKFSPELADRIITEAALLFGGVYKAVETYPHTEMIALVTCLSVETGIDTAELLTAPAQEAALTALHLESGKTGTVVARSTPTAES